MPVFNLASSSALADGADAAVHHIARKATIRPAAVHGSRLFWPILPPWHHFTISPSTMPSAALKKRIQRHIGHHHHSGTAALYGF